MKSIPTVLLAAALMAAGSPVPAPAGTLSSPPIAIVSCRAENFGGGYGGAVADVLIKFTNTYASPATSVKFSLNYQGQHKYVTTNGTFAPGITVTDRFHTFTDQPYMGKTMHACVVVKALFTDGSSWSM
ncbi:MAG: hypothetical protein JO347_03005 [Candidatus Eremiobacteraeota bacterium]|nr:hypothetical protein [Candidatus Eremiobacteraeota bacterium]